MVNWCQWNNQNYACGPFSAGKTSLAIDEQNAYFEKHLFETGSLALDVAALKINAACPKRVDVSVRIDALGDFANVSIGTDNPNETVLVVTAI